MSEANVQQLPPGLAGRVAAASQGAPAHQAPAAPAPAPIDQGPAVAPAPAPAAPQAPVVPQEPPINPMLSHVSQQPAPAVPQQQPAAPAVEPQAPQAPAAPAEYSSVTELAGEFARDSQLAPAVSYLDAVFKDNGLDINRALGQAAQEGDARFIDRAYLKEKLGDKADTIIRVAEDSITYVAAYNAESLNQVYATAGSEDGFRQAVDVFNKTADKTERAMLADLLNSGVRDKMLYAAKKIAEYGVKAGVVIKHQALPLGNPSAAQGLSRAEYIKAISEKNVTPERYDELRQLRELGRQQGR